MDGTWEARLSNVTNDAHHLNIEGVNEQVAAALAVDKTKPIAVVGMSCRFPGDSTCPDKLWDMLSKGRNGWSRGKKERFEMNAFYHPTSETSGTVTLTLPSISERSNTFLVLSSTRKAVIS